MKKFLLSICLLLSTSLYAWEKDVLVSTANTSILLSAPQNGELKIVYYGERIDQEQIPQIYNAGSHFHKPAYPV